MLERITNLLRQLMPTGRAFKVPFFNSGTEKGVLAKLIAGIARSLRTAWEDARSVQDAMLPDNDGFTADDATDWYRRLGIVNNVAVSLPDKKLAIRRKYAHPGTVKPRQNYRYMQGQLQAAGFNVFVFENRFSDGMGGYETKQPEEFSPGYPDSDIEHGDIEHGDIEHGGGYAYLIANSVSQAIDDLYILGASLKNTFFIGAEVPGDFADVDQNREKEFRQLILKLKPQQTVGFLLINYI